MNTYNPDEAAADAIAILECMAAAEERDLKRTTDPKIRARIERKLQLIEEREVAIVEGYAREIQMQRDA